MQEKAARLPPVEEIRTVLANSTRAMLSTLSKVFLTCIFMLLVSLFVDHLISHSGTDDSLPKLMMLKFEFDSV